MLIYSTKDINKQIENNVDEFVVNSENKYAGQLEKAAEHIAEARLEKPIVLLSGPSGSGKTTTAMRIGTLLEQKHGLKCKTISMDDYFRPMTSEEFADIQKLDLESPARLNEQLLAEHMEKIRKCEEIDIPQFDFTNQLSLDGEKFTRQPEQIVIFEGIHALNPDVTGSIYDHAMSIYVSVRTRIEHEGDLLHPSKIRLMRRLMRDKLFRGRAVEETLNFFSFVERGEKLYIMPYKNRAQIEIDTFIPFEASVYKKYLLPELEQIKDSYENYAKYADVETFLSLIDDIDDSAVPFNSLIREFVGGSEYEY